MKRSVDEVIAARRDGAAPDAPDLLDRMLRTADCQTGNRPDPVNIRQQIITFAVAGHETNSGALLFALYYFTRHPQALARADVDALLGQADDPDPSFNDDVAASQKHLAAA